MSLNIFKMIVRVKHLTDPEFKKLMDFANNNQSKIDYLLVVRWDRFSRNTLDTLNMVARFVTLGITIIPIDQDIDMNVPENYMMFLINVGYGEIENKRRSLNTKNGMIRARKEGRWVSNAPLGYDNRRDDDNKPIIVPNKKAKLIVEMFEKLATGCYTQEEIRKEYCKKGLKIGKTHINRIFLNQAYIGKIKIPAYNNEPEIIVQGIHEPIVREEVFCKVQDFLAVSNRRGKKIRQKNENLPLRNHLKCPECSRNLTGSASKGNGGKFYYYHCQRGCKVRFRASKVNSEFLTYLNSIKIKDEVFDLYLEIIQSLINDSKHNSILKKAKNSNKIEEIKQKILKVDNLYIENKLEADNYQRIINNLNEHLSQAVLDEKNLEKSISNDLLNKAEYGFSILKELVYYYDSANLEIKDRILSSIFPERLVYDSGKYRTNGNDNIISLLSEKNTEIEILDKEKASNNGGNSQMVARTGIEPVLSALRGRRVNQLHQRANSIQKYQ